MADENVGKPAQNARSQWAEQDPLLQSLGLTAEDVLLQHGTEHALQSARTGSGHGLLAAAWALARGDIGAAVDCLEAGRALMLQAVAAAGTVPERLRAAGADGLARSWDAAAIVLHDEGAQIDAAGDVYLSVPNDLRRDALEVLRRTRKSEPAATLGVIQRRLAASGLDALAYLLPGTQTPCTPARALVIRADGAALDLVLPGLSGAARAPFDAYLAAAQRRSRDFRSRDGLRDLERSQELQRALDREPRWQDCLDDLCHWAGSAVVDHLLDALSTPPSAAGPARIVLVPCGNLGLVPWHAALLSGKPDPDAPDRLLRACDLLVVSYAASAAELLRSLARPRTPYDTDPVIVVDPSSTLPYAVAEAAAVRRAYLPRARLMGRAEGYPVEAPGTPEDVLAALGGRGPVPPASLVQIIAHGTVRTRPTTSRLRLATPSETGFCDAPQPVRGRIGPEDLTVAAILEGAGGFGGAGDSGASGGSGDSDGSGGPGDSGDSGGSGETGEIGETEGTGGTGRCASLVVLDCCESDLTDPDHDEALTLGTACVARGAVDVVGSRWTVGDRTGAVCMIVFHHYLAVHKLPPADALRAAQRWMLGPAEHRERVPVLDEELSEHHYRSLDGVAAWAAFIHQGNARP